MAVTHLQNVGTWAGCSVKYLFFFNNSLQTTKHPWKVFVYQEADDDDCLCFPAVQCSGSIHLLPAINEGLQGELDWPVVSGPHQAMLVLGQEGPSPHPVSVGGPGPRHGSSISERGGPLHLWRGDPTRLVSLSGFVFWMWEKGLEGWTSNVTDMRFKEGVV